MDGTVIRNIRTKKNGKINWTGGESLDGLTVEEDRMCSLQDDEEQREQSNLIQKLVYFKTKNGNGTGSFAYVCQQNEFITHAPYMATDQTEIIYDVMLTIPADNVWLKADLNKWWIGDPTKTYTFGRFERQPIRLIVPIDLTFCWNEQFANPLTSLLANFCINNDQCHFSITSPLEVKVCRSLSIKDYIAIKIEGSNEMTVLGKHSEVKTAWPIHVFGNRALISGAPLKLPTSKIPEVNAFMAELNKYSDTCTQVMQAKAWSVWCLERAIEMYTAQRNGHIPANSCFDVYKIDYSKVYRPKINPRKVEDCSKGSGFALIQGNPEYDSLCEALLLKGASRSPMVIANSLQYNRFVFGKSKGTAMGQFDNLFLYDYGGDWTMPLLRPLIAGMGRRCAQVHDLAEDSCKAILEATIISYEYVRAKKRYEDNMRRDGIGLQYVCAWKEPRAMLHYRIVDAVFLKSTTTSSMDDEAYDVIGFATVFHDLIDYGYDLSVCDCSNMLFTLAARDGTYEGIEMAYAITVAGVKYVADVHRYNTSGLTLISTHYWQICNGRHRILNCAMSVAEHSPPRKLATKQTLLETIFNRQAAQYSDNVVHNHEQCKNKYMDLLARCEQLGNSYPKLLKCLVARPYERIYDRLLDDDSGIEDLSEVDNIISIIDCVCVDARNEGMELLWDIALFMWDETAIMWHALLGSMLVCANRYSGDDSAGYGYAERKWDLLGLTTST